MANSVSLVIHPERTDVHRAAELIRHEAERLGLEICQDPTAGNPPELILALGGDGTILSGARLAHSLNVPLMGLNFGHMGFLADTSNHTLAETIWRIHHDQYHLDTRMTLDVEVVRPDGRVEHEWALNEAAIVHSDLAHPVDLVFRIDGQDVSTYGADGIILATPTGSTAYSFSAGGPVVWPDTEAIVMAPLAAHGLFTRPLVVGPNSLLEVGVLEGNRQAPQVWMDGLVALEALPGSLVRTRRGKTPVTLAHLEDQPFSERLVSKFSLPVSGWRSNPEPFGPLDD